MAQIVKVKRETLEACMTCPLCNKLLKEPTTVSLCLHTFCRRCIYEKLSDEEVDSCPVCYIDLGCLPEEKLRPDHNLQDIRGKIFPYKRMKIITPEVMPSVSPPAKRKERSLSSLVVSAPKVPIHSGLTGKRTKASARRVAFQGRGNNLEESSKKEDSTEDCPMTSSPPDSPKKCAQYKRQDASFSEPSNELRSCKETENDAEAIEGKGDLWTPLNCLVEAANRTKSSRTTLPGPSVGKSGTANSHDSEPETKAKAESNALDNEIKMPRTKNKEHGYNVKVKDEKSENNSLPGPVKRKRLRAAERRRAAASKKICASAKAMLGAAIAKHNRSNCPIWFSLVAAEDQNDDASLPQISACYLRIKDGKMPVSFIQKYLIKKLDLPSEAEVEILCRGQPVLPTLQLQNLVDLWFRTASMPKAVPASVGSSAKDFVMVLSYCRKTS